MNAHRAAEPEVLVSGRIFILTLLAAIAVAGFAGIITYYGLMALTGRALGSALPQIAVFAVYATLLFVFCYSFWPAGKPPIALRFTGMTDIAFAVGATFGLIALCSLVYAPLGHFFGGFRNLPRTADRCGDRCEAPSGPKQPCVGDCDPSRVRPCPCF